LQAGVLRRVGAESGTSFDIWHWAIRREGVNPGLYPVLDRRKLQKERDKDRDEGTIPL